jgi:hypothetical protein
MNYLSERGHGSLGHYLSERGHGSLGIWNPFAALTGGGNGNGNGNGDKGSWALAEEKPEEKLEAKTPAAKSLLDKYATISLNLAQGVINIRQAKELRKANEAQAAAMLQAGTLSSRGMPSWVIPVGVGVSVLALIMIFKGR